MIALLTICLLANSNRVVRSLESSRLQAHQGPGKDPVVELGRAIIELVSGELPEAPEGKFWFYGTPTGRQTLGRRSPD